jgi:hypothetical protein
MKQDEFVSTPESISLLYGETFYIVPSEEVNQKPVALASQPKAAPIKEAIVTEVPEKPVAPKVEEKVIVTATQPIRPGIQWKGKPTAKMMFILQQVEFKDPVLVEFLKKIVEALGIPFDAAGFGVISGPVHLSEFEAMPIRYGVVFDGDLWMSPNMATSFGDNEVFFSMRLAYLQNDPESKRQLWGYLKNLKDMLV